MNLLLDTHVVLWFMMDDPKLPKTTRARVKNGENACFVSLASYWEISIKYALGRLDLKKSLEEIFDIINQSDFEILHITPNHLLRTAKLPHHHRDPFDRLIIGQALEEGITIISKDRQFRNYQEVQLIWE